MDKEKVRDGYDEIAIEYREERKKDCEGFHLVETLIDILPEDSKVLDAGCGSGVPITKELSKYFDVVGVDFSQKQIDLAKNHIEDAEFIKSDLLELDFSDKVFDAIFSFFTFRHIPIEEQKIVLEKMYRFLKDGGYFLVSVGREEWDGKNEDWLGTGVEMQWSQTGLDESIRVLEDLGFKIVCLINEFDCGEGKNKTPFILAKKK